MTIWITLSYVDDDPVSYSPQINVYDSQAGANKHKTQWENVLGRVDIHQFNHTQFNTIFYWEHAMIGVDLSEAAAHESEPEF